MTVLGYQEIDGFLAGGKPPWPPVFLLFGEEVLYRRVQDKITAVLLGDDSHSAGLETLEGSDENILEALSKVNTFSLLAARKVVLLSDVRLFLTRQNEDRLWAKARQHLTADAFAKAARLFLEGLRLHGLTPEDLTPPADWEALLGAPPASGDWEWAKPLAAYCLEQGLRVGPTADPSEALEKAVTHGFPAGQHLIITSSLVDKRRRLFQTLQQQGVVVDCSVPAGDTKSDRAAQGAVLAQTVDERLAPLGKRMDREARQELFDLTGFDLRMVAANVDQLASFTGERMQITRADVRQVLTRTRRDPLYAFTDAVTDRNLSQALFLLRALLEGGDFDHPLPLLAAVANQMRRLLVAKTFAAGPHGRAWHHGCRYPAFQQQVLPGVKDFDEALRRQLEDWETALHQAAEAGQAPTPRRRGRPGSDLLLMAKSRSPFPVFRLLEKAERFARRELVEAMETLAEADQRLKRTGMPGRLVLEAAVIRICGPQGAGPSAEAR
jgi:DNA polymerase-3 subunit delta